MKIALTIIVLLFATTTFAADSYQSGQTTRMKSNGQIETTIDYGSFDVRITNGKVETIQKPEYVPYPTKSKSNDSPATKDSPTSQPKKK